MDLAIVVVAYNCSSVLEGLLDSLPAACEDLRIQIVIVDNGSTDDTVALVNERNDCRLIQQENLGYSAGINAGVRATAPSGAILVLNPDIRLKPRSVKPLLAAIRDPKIGIVAPKIVDRNEELSYSLRREPTITRSLGLTSTGLPLFSEYVTRPVDYNRPHVVDWALGAALLVSRQCHDELGGWDESYFLYSEETDFCLRARDLGFLTMYIPNAVVVHLEGASGRSTRTYAMQAINRIRLYRRRNNLVKSWIFLMLLTAREVVRAAAGDLSARFVVVALLRPATRPKELACSESIIPV